MVTGARLRHWGAGLKESEMRGSTSSSPRVPARSRARAAGIAVALAVTALAPATASANTQHHRAHRAHHHVTTSTQAIYFGHKIG